MTKEKVQKAFDESLEYANTAFPADEMDYEQRFRWEGVRMSKLKELLVAD